MTFAELKQRVRERLQEDAADPLRWTDTVLGRLLNAGHVHMVARSGCLLTDVTLSQLPGQFDYSLPSDCIRMERLYRDSAHQKVWPISLRRLDELRRNWREITGTHAEWYFVFGLDTVYMGPALTTGSEDYTLTYAQDAGHTSLSAGTDEPLVPRRFHEALVDYAFGRALLMGARDEARIAKAAWTVDDKQILPGALGRYLEQVKRLRRQSEQHLDARHQMRRQDAGPEAFGAPA